MSSRIEQLINEIDEYIEECKFKAFSNTEIIVNKDEIQDLLGELRLRIPDEVKLYQKIISNQDAIISDAQAQAQEMLAQATAQTDELVNEHEIMQRAYAQANEVVAQAQAQAQEIIDRAVAEADEVRKDAIHYTDGMLNNLQMVVGQTMDEAQGRFQAFMQTMQSTYDVVVSNREELAGSLVTMEGQPQQEPETDEEEQ
ncbi:vacuolar family H+-ATPase subunit H [Lachnoclostridium sp. An14]|uniref:vacuolar family H+-ATPase subunit H n=1 Tax=Lachnoclostridium sp. An14 TaxID=1965562 RepID=UPI000B3961CF|nr:vacuolar family H+-ATPase subunit H [Lachnoclostridium sp. An14]OUQ21838.1 vacuolar family H+-ATPase subunit H [Lachnoclostridium sp. An14]